MNRTQLIFVAAALMGTSTWACAQEAAAVKFTGRIGPTVGLYEGEFETRVTSDGVALDEFTFDDGGDAEFAYGLATGLTAGFGDFFADAGLEYLASEFAGGAGSVEFDRVDILLTLGYLVGARGSVFGGFRVSKQGSEVFDDDLQDEEGFFIGAGLGGLDMGSVLISASAAYNFSELKEAGFSTTGSDQPDVDYDGFSVKLAAALKAKPQHSLELRVQRFNGDDSFSAVADFDGDGVAEEVRASAEFTETYVQLTYLYRFTF